MTDKEKLERLRSFGFYGIDREMISKLKKPEVYAIQLTTDARRCLGEISRPDTKKTQNERIVEYAQKMGGITSWDATNILNIMSFTKRMSEIRRDPRFEVTQRWEGNGHTKWMLYEIKEKKDAESV